MDKIYEYNDNLLYAIEEVNILSKYKDNEVEFKNKLKELNFDNTEISYEHVIRDLTDVIIVIFKKIIEYIKKAYYFAFGHARRLKFIFTALKKKFNDGATKIGNDNFGKIMIEKSLSAKYIKALTDISNGHISFIDKLIDGTKLARTIFSVGQFDAPKKDEFYKATQKLEYINGNTAKYIQYEYNEQYIIDMIKHYTNVEAKSFSELDYTVKIINSIFDTAIECCDTLISRKANIEYIISGYNSFVNDFKSGKATLDESGDYDSVVAVKSNATLINSALKGSHHALTLVKDMLESILANVYEFIKVNKDSLK